MIYACACVCLFGGLLWSQRKTSPFIRCFKPLFKITSGVMITMSLTQVEIQLLFLVHPSKQTILLKIERVISNFY